MSKLRCQIPPPKQHSVNISSNNITIFDRLAIKNRKFQDLNLVAGSIPAHVLFSVNDLYTNVVILIK